MVQEFTSDDTQATASPQIIPMTISSLCSLLPRPLIMTGLFRELLVRHFADQENIETPDLAHLLWRGTEQTGILIESIHRWRPELTEFRPAVIIKRNAFKIVKKGIGHLLQMPSSDGFGNPHYASFMVGSHTLFCVGGTGAQAELLATEVYREIHHFGPLIRKEVDLKLFEAVEYGAVSEIEEAQESFMVPVTIGYAYEDRWTITKEALRLRSVPISYILDG